MGKIFTVFGKLSFRNEAQVSQNFLLPLLTEFLNYERIEIFPEILIPAFRIPQNRSRSISNAEIPPKGRPDYIVTIGGLDHKVFACDAKEPREELALHLDQLKAYCIALGINLLLITNGKELSVYDANERILQSNTIEDLDVKFPELYTLLGKSSAEKHTVPQRIHLLDIFVALDLNAASQTDQVRRNAIHNSDFVAYLREVSQVEVAFDLPDPIKNAFNTDFQRFPADQLYTFADYESNVGISFSRQEPITYQTFLEEELSSPLLLIGESGIGKTFLTQQILSDRAKLCLQNLSPTIPVLIRLGSYSGSQPLIELIYETLYSRGASIQVGEVPTLLRAGRLLLIFDAFDEILDAHISDAERELQTLIENYRKTSIIITTRHFRSPSIAGIKKYEIAQLSEEKIAHFAQFYLGLHYTELLKAIKDSFLMRIVSNTLLLSLLILIYLKNRHLPHSRGQILQTVVDTVRSHDQKKHARFAISIGWRVRTKLLSRLAFLSVSKGMSYTLDATFVQDAILEATAELERDRLIPSGMTLDQILDDLAATGFILRSSGGIAFWHRTFMEYFAADEIALRLKSQPTVLGEFVQSPVWESLLPLAIAKSATPNELLAKTLQYNVFTAAKAYIECQERVAGDVSQQVTEALIKRCDSAQITIRQIAMSLIVQLRSDYVDEMLQILVNSQYVDVQKSALTEIVRRKLPSARDLVFARLDWDVSDGMPLTGGSIQSVLEALAQFDDLEAHHQFMTIWNRIPDMFTRATCCNALLGIIQRNKMTDQLKREVLNKFLKIDTKHDYHYALKTVLLAMNDPQIGYALISAIERLDRNDVVHFTLHATDVLASYSDVGIVRSLIRHATDTNLNHHHRAVFAHALCGSKGEIPLETFKIMASDRNYGVRRYGIEGLKRFAFNEIKPLVLQAVHPPSIKRSLETNHSYGWVQSTAFEVLAHFGQVDLLNKRENHPEYLYNISVETLCHIIAQQKLSVMIPLLNSILEKWRYQREKVQIAWTFADLGDAHRAIVIVDEVLQNPDPEKYVYSDIAEGVQRLPEDYALDVIDKLVAITGSGLLQMQCIDALGRLGSHQARRRLTAIAQDATRGNDLLDVGEALLALEFIATPDLEDWLIKLLSEHPNIERFALRRGIEILGIIGSDNSLPLLQQYLKSEYFIQATCFWAIQEIYKRNGKLWFNHEEMQPT